MMNSGYQLTLLFLYATGSKISYFCYIKTRARKIATAFVLLFLSWRFYRAKKINNCHMLK